MNVKQIVQNVRRDISDPLKTFRLFERLIAIICIAMPVFLLLFDTEKKGLHFRSSISDYVYMPASHIFGMMLCIAAMLFIFNGAVYFKNQSHLKLKRAGKWYNVILGLSLLGVILLPYKENKIPHYFFAVIFFLGNAAVIGFFHKKKDRIPGVALAILTVVFLAICVIGLIPVFWGEWLSLTVIGIHFILEARDLRPAKIKPRDNTEPPKE